MSEQKNLTVETFENLVQQIQRIHSELTARANKAVNISLTLRNWLIGLQFAEYELRGSDRAEYGDQLFTELARRLKTVSNCNRRQLYRYVRFYRLYPSIVGALPPQFKTLPSVEKTSKKPGKEKVGAPNPLSVSAAQRSMSQEPRVGSVRFGRHGQSVVCVTLPVGVAKNGRHAAIHRRTN